MLPHCSLRFQNTTSLLTRFNGCNAMPEPQHRELRFTSIADCSQELDRIEAAHDAGTLKTTGSWTAGENLSHLAAWIEYGYDGYPIKPPPFFVRWILKRGLKRMFAAGKMSSGVKIPGVEGGTVGQEQMETKAALERFRNALARMQSEPTIHHSPAFGKLSDEDRIKLNLLHAQLHLGFLDYPA